MNVPEDSENKPIGVVRAVEAIRSRVNLGAAWKVVQVLLGVLVLYFIGRYLYAAWSELASFSFDLNLWIFALAFLPLGGFYFIYSRTWVHLVRDLSEGSLKVRDDRLFKIFYLAFVSRYIPGGKITNIGGRIELFHRAGGDRAAAFQSFILEQFDLFGGAFFVSFISLLLVPVELLPEFVQPFRSLLVMAGALLSIAFWVGPYLLSTTAGWWSRTSHLLGRINSLPWMRRAEYAVLYLVINILQGSAILLMLAAIDPNILRLNQLWPLIIAAYPLGRIGGQLVTFIPSGLGVREGLFTFLVAGGTGLEAALIGAALFRVTSIISELGILGGLSLYQRNRPNNEGLTSATDRIEPIR
jgi:hypothetical protein